MTTNNQPSVVEGFVVAADAKAEADAVKAIIEMPAAKREDALTKRNAETKQRIESAAAQRIDAIVDDRDPVS